MNDTAQVQFFGGHQRKPFLQIKSHLMAEHTNSTRSGAIRFLGAFIQNALQKLVILLHGVKIPLFTGGSPRAIVNFNI